LIAGSALAVGRAVAVTGAIGFVGLIARACFKTGIATSVC
jgi:ABC-type Fe3+-siderophore transport system permease subunit